MATLPYSGYWRSCPGLTLIQLMMTWLSKAVPLVVIFGIWQAVAMAVQLVRGVRFPTPGETLLRLYELLSGKSLPGHVVF